MIDRPAGSSSDDTGATPPTSPEQGAADHLAASATQPWVLSRRKALALGGSAGLAAFIAACTRAPVADPGATPTPGESPTPGAPPATERDTLTFFALTGFTSMDPLMTVAASATPRLIWDPLQKVDWYDARHVDGWGALEPEADGNFLIHVNPDAKFHDGSSVTADDVVFTYKDRILNPDVSRSAGRYPELVEDIVKVDDLTARVIAKVVPTPDMHLVVGGMVVQSKAWTEGKSAEEVANSLNGTGPYTMTRFVVDQVLELERFDDYYGAQPGAPKVTVRLSTDQAAMILACQRGEADIARGLAVDSLPEARAAGYRIEHPTGWGVACVQLYTVDQENKLAPGTPNPLRDIRVRQALNYLIDKESIMASVLGGVAEPMRGMSGLPTMRAYNPPEAYEDFSYDADRGLALLAEAGYEDGFPFKIHLPEGIYEKGTEVTLAIADQLNRVGVRTSIEPMPVATWVAERNRAALGPSTLDMGYSQAAIDARQVPRPMLRGITQSFEDADAEAALRDTETVVDFDEQTEALKRLNVVFWNAVPAIWLWHTSYTFALAPHIEWDPTPARYDLDFSSLRFIDG